MSERMFVRGYEIKPAANLRRAKLVGADLTNANLRGATLADASLRGADLRRADLRGAVLRNADLTEATLTDAGLRGADLRGATLADASLRGADLWDADLRNADLRNAALRNADLADADLRRADLVGASLTDATLCGTDLYGADLTRAILTRTCLDPEAPVPALTDEEILEAGLEIESELVYGWRTERSKWCGDTVYEPGQCYEAPWFSVCQETLCHPGIYLAGLEWLKEYYGRPRLVHCYCRRNELVHAGNMWRCKRLWVK